MSETGIIDFIIDCMKNETKNKKSKGIEKKENILRLLAIYYPNIDIQFMSNIIDAFISIDKRKIVIYSKKCVKGCL